MRPRLAVPSLLLALLAPASLAAPPREPMDAARALDDPSWEERRRAESDLVALGREAIEATDAGADARLSAWDAALAAAERGGGPGPAEAVTRVLRRLERDLDDVDVRRAPRLLRARLERLVTWLVADDLAEAPGGLPPRRGRPEASPWPVDVIRDLLPEGRPALVDLVRTADDPRLLAGAVAAMGELRQGADPDLLAAVGEAWDADPDRVAAACRFTPRGWHPPLVTVALSLALSGRASDLPRLKSLLAADTLGAFGNALRVLLVVRGEGDLTIGEFVGQLEGGAVSADDQAEAARRALDANLPWLARLLARRALFLSRAHAPARRTLVAADEAIGLRATARADGGLLPQDGVADDPDAAAIDATLRAGRLSQRLLHRIEAGTDDGPGLAPVAIGEGFLVVGTTQGIVKLVDADTARVIAFQGTSVSRLPRGLAVVNGVVAAVTARGGAYYWRVEAKALRRAGLAVGPFLAVAAGADGSFWFLGARRTLLRAEGPTEPQEVPGLELDRGFLPTAFAALEGGAVLLAGDGRVLRFDPATAALITLAEGDARTLRAGPYGKGAVVAHGTTFDILSETGERTGGGRLPEGARITGVFGDAATGTVYVATAESIAAFSADGTLRWTESVEGSANPVVARGLVAVSAGLGRQEGGDGRRDRTISVLRAGIERNDPFAPDARTRAVEAVVAAAGEGRPTVGRALLDPIAAWLTPSERLAAEQALIEHEGPGREGRGADK